MHELVADGGVEISFQVPEGKELWIVSIFILTSFSYNVFFLPRKVVFLCG